MAIAFFCRSSSVIDQRCHKIHHLSPLLGKAGMVRIFVTGRSAFPFRLLKVKAVLSGSLSEAPPTCTINSPSGTWYDLFLRCRYTILQE